MKNAIMSEALNTMLGKLGEMQTIDVDAYGYCILRYTTNVRGDLFIVNSWEGNIANDNNY